MFNCFLCYKYVRYLGVAEIRTTHNTYESVNDRLMKIYRYGRHCKNSEQMSLIECCHIFWGLITNLWPLFIIDFLWWHIAGASF